SHCRCHAGRTAVLTWHVFDTATVSTVDVMMVVGPLNFEAGGCWAKLQFSNQTDIHQRLHHGVDRLDGDRRKGQANLVQQLISGRVWYLFEGFQRRNTLLCGP